MEHLRVELAIRQIPSEILVVDDRGTDETWGVLTKLASKYPEVRALQNKSEPGFGRAVILGLDQIKGDAIVFSEADLSVAVPSSVIRSLS